MSEEEIHVGDIGTVFEFTVYDHGELLPGMKNATNMKITFTDPDEGKVSKTADFTTDGTDSKMQYVSIVDDLDMPGKWHIQASLTMPTGSWSSDISDFYVHPNL
ncbi:MAG: hypothetical protein KAS32_23130 [Candidatus Peribacteraceae bacterium]|nr:hypothetical protein [Candidatus Peribacteraceae bacterium]